MINVNGRNGTMIIYGNFTTLSSHETFTSLWFEYIATTFNANTREAILIIALYKPSTLSLSMFKIHFQCRTINWEHKGQAKTFFNPEKFYISN